MKCLYCPVDLVAQDYKGLNINKCPQCNAVWIEKEKLRDFKDRVDEFLCWLEIDLWKHLEKHGVKRSTKRCTLCGDFLYDVNYHESNIVLPVCFKCEGLWLDEKNNEKLFDYLKDLIDNETITGFLKEMGHETIDLMTGKESFKQEIHDLKTILVLIEYKIFSKIPALSRIIREFPK